MDLGHRLTTLVGRMSPRHARSVRSLALAAVLAVACGASGPANPAAAGNDAVAGVDTSDLTAQERRLFAEMAQHLASPCPGPAAPLASCNAGSNCTLCPLAAGLVKEQIRRGKPPELVRAAYKARFDPELVREVLLAPSPVLGRADAPVVVVVWADFECGHCGKAGAILHRLVERHPSQVCLVFKHFPISSHANAEFAATAAVAAQAQGKFWAFHDRMFETQAVGLGESRVRALARELGLDMAAFEESIASDATAAVIRADRQQALRLGLRGTPMVYVNGRFFDPTHFDLAQDIDAWVRLELELAKASGAASANGATP